MYLLCSKWCGGLKDQDAVANAKQYAMGTSSLSCEFFSN